MVIFLDKTSTEGPHTFLPCCPIAVRILSRNFVEGEVKDFTQEWQIREESPVSLIPKEAGQPVFIGVSNGKE